jgi:uncharacterized membrane protein YhhN
MSVFILVLLLADLVVLLAIPRSKPLTKSLLMPLLVVFYLLEAKSVDPWLLGALAAALVGDVLLLRYDSPPRFLAGQVAFLIGQVLWAIAFLNSMGGFKNVPLWFALVAIPYGAALLFLLARLWKCLAENRAGFVVYGASILFMSAMALARGFSFSGPAFWLPFVGSLFFIVSDTTLAFHVFHGKIRHDDLYVMPTYVAAQTLLVLGLVLF